MGLIDDKKNIFITIGAYVSLSESTDLPDGSNLFSSINNKEDIGAFLIDVLNVVVGTNALKQLTGELFSSFAEDTEPIIKKSLSDQTIDYNSGNDLPSQFITTGINVPVNEIDINGKLKNNPNSSSGELIYGDNNNSFDRKAKNAIQNENNFVQYNDLLIRYNSNDDTFTFKPTSNSSNKSIGQWLGGIIFDSQFLNKKEFTSNIFDKLFGSVSSTENKTIEDFFNDLKLDSLLQKIIEDEEEPTVSEDEYGDLYKKANELKSGVSEYDMGCGILTGELSLENISNLVNEITQSSDPNEISDLIDNNIMNSFNSTDEDGVSDENQETIRNGFFHRIIMILIVVLLRMTILSPQSRMILALSSAFQNNGNPQIGDPEDDFTTFKTTIDCLKKEALASLHEFIFNLILTSLVELLNPIIKKIIREKINAYIGVVKSLVSSNI